MKKIFVGEGCFGPVVRVDGESMHLNENDTRTDEDVDKLRMIVIQEMIKNRKMLSTNDWMEIIQILGNSLQWNVIDQSNDSCDQCGNYNWDITYEI